MNIQNTRWSSAQMVNDLGNLLKDINAKQTGFEKKMIGINAETRVKAAENANKGQAIDLFA